MYTGLIQAMGTVASAELREGKLRLVIDPQGWAPALGRAVQTGDSIAIDGACLTVVDLGEGLWAFDAIPETLSKTTLGQLKPGDAVHIEPSLSAGEPMGGHWVQGHVDGVGVVTQPATQDNGWRLRLSAPTELDDYLLLKGSITIAGVSLTIAERDADGPGLGVALIPETLERTKLGALQPGDAVNLEADFMAKAVVTTTKRYLNAGRAGASTEQPVGVTTQTLRDAGFMR
ncbi:MAG: riboflavin synthase [Planctomycetota bacterium]